MHMQTRCTYSLESSDNTVSSQTPQMTECVYATPFAYGIPNIPMPTCTDMLTGKRDISFSDSHPGRGKGGAALWETRDDNEQHR